MDARRGWGRLEAPSARTPPAMATPTRSAKNDTDAERHGQNRRVELVLTPDRRGTLLDLEVADLSA